MTLDQYLSESGETNTAFSARVGISQSQIGRLRRGWKPSWDTIVAIEKATGGKVQPNDWPRDAGEGKAA
jgi:DNA-binding transcriptional regulator YdaS (Cro superfamily)